MNRISDVRHRKSDKEKKTVLFHYAKVVKRVKSKKNIEKVDER